MAISKMQVERFTATGEANTLHSFSTPVGKHRRLVQVAVHYDGSPTQGGVTVTLDSGAGAVFDTVLLAGTENEQDTMLFPEADLLIMDDDAISVDAPAGGAGITASIAIYTEIIW